MYVMVYWFNISHAGYWKNTLEIENREPKVSGIQAFQVFVQHPKQFIEPIFNKP